MPRKAATPKAAKKVAKKIEELKEEVKELKEEAKEAPKKVKPVKGMDDYKPNRRDAVELAAHVVYDTTKAQKMQLLRSMINQPESQKENGKERLKEYNMALKEAARMYRVGWVPHEL
jgi:hypothetical protein